MTSILCFDLETTGPPEGPDRERDRIVQMSFWLWSFEDGVPRRPDARRSELVYPGADHLPIPPERTAVHGIETADVERRHPFDVHADGVQMLVASAAWLCGFGSRGYDVPILHRHLLEAGRPGLSTDEHGRIDHPEIDLHRLWRRLERRNLITASARFGNGRLTEDSAHDAEADAAVLTPILTGMVEEFGLAEYDDGDPPGGVNWPRTLVRLQDLSCPEEEVDRAGKFVRDEDGVILLAFGKHEGEPAVAHLDYLEWIIGADFPAGTKAVARAVVRGEAADV